jgi:hypothetical protein
MIHYSKQRLVWRSSSCQKHQILMSHLETILHSWEDTPYLAGQQEKRVGVDCVRFVTAVLDELLHIHRTAIPRLPQDTAMHSRRGAISTMRLIRKLYPPAQIVRNHCIEPGDILVVGYESGGPGHALIVGAQKNTIWQAGSVSVHQGGIGLISRVQRLFRIYRLDWDTLL